MFKIVIVGTGWWGMELGNAAHSLTDNVEVGGCHSLSQEECTEFQSKYGGKVYADMDHVLDDDSVDAVFLATPHSLHWTQIMNIAKAGKHVFCEKPLALSVRTASAAIQSCHENSVVLGVGHNRRFSPVVEKMKEMVEAGECGQIIHAEGNYSGNGGFKYAPDYWRAQREELPGGGLTPMALHVVDSMTWILGPIKRLAALSKSQAVPIKLDDTTAALFELNSGVTASLGTLMAVPQANYLRIYGTKVNLEATGNFSQLTVTRLEAKGPEVLLKLDDDQTLRREITNFQQACTGGEVYRVLPEEALRNVAVVEAIKNSAAADGAWMDVAQDVV